MRKSRRKRLAEAHVRLYRHELECDAYKTLSPAARALLIELRGLYSGGENRVFMSRDNMAVALNVGRRVAVRARDELIERGWVRVIEKGKFASKNRKATIYMLTNEPESDRLGATAPKDFLKWKAPNSAESNFHEVQHGPSYGTSCAPSKSEHTPKAHGRGTPRTTSEANLAVHGVHHVPTDKVTRVPAETHPLLIAAFQSNGRDRFLYCLLVVCLVSGGGS